MVGISLTLLSIFIAVAVIAVDAVGAGKWGGLGPAQMLALRAVLVVLLVGLSLVPLGDRPA
jgi:hypothetical protein